LKRSFLAWKRPVGHYSDGDGHGTAQVLSVLAIDSSIQKDDGNQDDDEKQKRNARGVGLDERRHGAQTTERSFL